MNASGGPQTESEDRGAPSRPHAPAQVDGDDDLARTQEELLARRAEQLAALCDLTSITGSAGELAEIYKASLDALRRGLNVHRASILLLDSDGVMRFKSWWGISSDYRHAVEGHSPWGPGVRPEPLLIRDAERDVSLGRYREIVLQEGIRSLAFIPLLHRGRLLGKFMLYGDGPRRFLPEEVRLAETIANHVALAIHRYQAEAGQRAQLLTERAARLRAEDEVRTQQDQLARLSHDLRTPLSLIVGWGRLLEEGAVAQAARGKAVRTIQRSAEALTGLLDDFTDASRIARGLLRLETEDLDLAVIVAEVVEALRPNADVKDVRIRLQVGPGVTSVQGDPARLRRVAWNLVAAAIRRAPRASGVEIALERSGEAVDWHIRLTGDVPAGVLDGLLDPPASPVPGETGAPGGASFGLAAVRHIIQSHGGMTEAAVGGAGRAVGFFVRLPALAGFESDEVPTRPGSLGAGTFSESEASKAPALPDLSGLSVLVVEDEDNCRELLATTLRECGASVREAESGAEALRHFTAHRPDVLVSDIVMPMGDGYDLIRAVRSQEATGSGEGPVPAVAITGYSGEENRRRAMEAGYQRHLEKPVNPFRLALLVRELSTPDVRTV